MLVYLEQAAVIQLFSVIRSTLGCSASPLPSSDFASTISNLYGRIPAGRFMPSFFLREYIKSTIIATVLQKNFFMIIGLIGIVLENFIFDGFMPFAPGESRRRMLLPLSDGKRPFVCLYCPKPSPFVVVEIRPCNFRGLHIIALRGWRYAVFGASAMHMHLPKCQYFLAEALSRN